MLNLRIYPVSQVSSLFKSTTVVTLVLLYNQTLCQRSIETTLQLGHNNWVLSVCASHNDLVASAGRDNIINIWSTKTGKLVTSIKDANITNSRRITNLDMDDLGKYLLSKRVNQPLRVWDIEENRQVGKFKTFGRQNAIFNTEKQSVIIHRKEQPEGKASLWEWHIPTKTWTRKYEGEFQSLEYLKSNSVNSRLVAWDQLNGLYVWDTKSNELLGTFNHTSNIKTFTLHESLDQLAFVDNQSQMITWDFIDNKVIAKKRLKSLNNLKIAEIDPSFQKIYVNLTNSGINIIDIEDDKVIHQLSGHIESTNQLLLNKGYLISCSDDTSLKVWDIMTNDLLWTFTSMVTRTIDVQYSPTANIVAILSGHSASQGARFVDELAKEDLGIRLVDLQEGTIKQIVTGSEVKSIVFSKDGNQLITGDNKGIINIWDVVTGQNQGTLSLGVNARTGWLDHMVLNNDGKTLVALYSGGVLAKWDLQRQELLLSVRTPSPYALAINRDGIIATGHQQSIILWDSSLKTIKVLKGHKSVVSALDFSPKNPNLLVSGSFDHRVNSWNILEEDEPPVTIYKHKYFVADLNFNHSGTKVASSGWDNSVMIYDLKSKKIEDTLSVHTLTVDALDFSSEDNFLISGGSDGRNMLWDCNKSYQPLMQLSFVPKSEDYVFYTDDGYYMSTPGGTQAVSYTIGTSSYHFDQFDLYFNRPDKVIERIGLNKELSSSFEQAFRKRLEKLNTSEDKLESYRSSISEAESPEVHINGFNVMEGRKATMEVTISNKGRSEVNKIFVAVNGCPIYETPGKSIKVEVGKSIRMEVALELSAGNNQIEVWVMNKDRVYSLREYSSINSKLPRVKPKLYLFSIGVSQYYNSDANLRYADKDATDVARLFADSKLYADVDSIVMINTQATREKINSVIDWLRQTEYDDHVIIFYSGHGLIDNKMDYYLATHSVDFRDPSNNGLPFEDLESLLLESKSRNKLLLIDACYSGEIDKQQVRFNEIANTKNLSDSDIRYKTFGNRQNGALGNQSAFQLMKELFVDLRNTTGINVISSSSGVEFSEEKEGNGLFTYALKKALSEGLADKNNDAEITISELEEAIRQIVQKTSEGIQSPNFRTQNYKNDFRIW